MITVVSGFSRKGYELYGKNFLDTFARHAPHGLGLVVYVPDPIKVPYGSFVLHDELDGVQQFIERNENRPEAHGRAPVPGWRKKDERVGYSYRYDAIKFCWQLFYPEHAAQSLDDGEILAWFDGDVIFTNQMQTGFIDAGLQGADLIYLGRETHTELGFWAVRLNANTRAFLRYMADLYRTDRIFQLQEWHSAFVFDSCRPMVQRQKNLIPDSSKGSVWNIAPLGLFSIHLKGKLKLKGTDQPNDYAYEC